MASSEVIDAVVARLQTFLATNPVARPEGSVWPLIKPDEESAPPSDGGSFISLQFPAGSEDMITAGGSIGHRLVREVGVIRLIVSVPQGNGQSIGLAMINALRGQFRYAEFSVVRTFGASPAVNNNDNDNGAWWVLSSAITYWFDFTA